MRTKLATTALLIGMLSVAACSTDDDPSPDPSGTAGASQAPDTETMSVQEFCDDYGEEVMDPLAQDFVAATETFGSQLQDLEPSDTEGIDQVVNGLSDATEPLAEAMYDAAEQIEDSQVASDLTAAADQLSGFPGAIRDALQSASEGENPGAALQTTATDIQDAMNAVSGHCDEAQ